VETKARCCLEKKKKKKKKKETLLLLRGVKTGATWGES
jgi:hypothetical protein